MSPEQEAESLPDRFAAWVEHGADQTFEGIKSWVQHPEILQLFVFLTALSIPITWILIVDRVALESLLAFATFGPEFITGSNWIVSPPIGRLPSLGALPAIYGSVVTTMIALLIAVPVSLGVGLFQSELAPRQLRAPSVFLVEMLAAVSNVRFCVWGIVVLVSFIGVKVDPSLKSVPR